MLLPRFGRIKGLVSAVQAELLLMGKANLVGTDRRPPPVPPVLDLAWVVGPLHVLPHGVRNAEELVVPHRKGLRIQPPAGELHFVTTARDDVDRNRLTLPRSQLMGEPRQEGVVPPHCF